MSSAFHQLTLIIFGRQGTLITIAIAALAVLVNVYGAKRLPWIEIAMLIFHIIGFIAILVPLLALAPKADAKAVFTSFSNSGGWASVGGACVVGQLGAAGASVLL